jgi:hypothetical protein
MRGECNVNSQISVLIERGILHACYTLLEHCAGRRCTQDTGILTIPSITLSMHTHTGFSTLGGLYQVDYLTYKTAILFGCFAYVLQPTVARQTPSISLSPSTYQTEYIQRIKPILCSERLLSLSLSAPMHTTFHTMEYVFVCLFKDRCRFIETTQARWSVF